MIRYTFFSMEMHITPFAFRVHKIKTKAIQVCSGVLGQPLLHLCYHIVFKKMLINSVEILGLPGSTKS